MKLSNKSKSIITGSIILTLIIGSLNSIYKHDKLPGLRFYFGSGVLWLFLVGLGEFEEEVAKTLALAIATFVVIGEGGGVLDHFLGYGTSKHTLDTAPKAPNHNGGQPATAIVPRPLGHINAPAAQIGMVPVMPVIPGPVIS